MARSQEEITTILGFAKLDKADMLPGVQCLCFPMQIDNGEVQLIELEKGMMQQLKEGDRLTIRGEKHETAVLCSKQKTYEIKTAETSNALMLTPSLQFPGDENMPDDITNVQVTGMLHNYYELRHSRPRLNKLNVLLSERPYSGPIDEQDENQTGRKYTYSDLQSLVQASEQELDAALSKANVLDIDGYQRVLEFDYLSQVLGHLASLLEEEGWETDKVPFDGCLATLQDLFPSFVIEHLLTSYGQQNPREEEEAVTYKLEEDLICRVFAEMVLRPAGKFNLREFEEVWQSCVPKGFKTSHHQLQGLALIDRDSSPEVVFLYDVADLPEDEMERFDTLFRTKAKWTLDEITPYISGLVPDTAGVGALLLKHARSSSQSGTKLYTSRRPVL